MIDINSFGLGGASALVVFFAFLGLLWVFDKGIVRRSGSGAPQAITCPRCHSKKVVDIVEEPGKSWCKKCGKEWGGDPLPVVRPVQSNKNK